MPLPARFQVVLYMRKHSNQPMDIELVLYSLLAAIDVFSGTLVAVLVLVSLYWLAMAKLQVGGARWGDIGVKAQSRLSVGRLHGGWLHKRAGKRHTVKGKVGT